MNGTYLPVRRHAVDVLCELTKQPRSVLLDTELQRLAGGTLEDCRGLARWLGEAGLLIAERVGNWTDEVGYRLATPKEQRKRDRPLVLLIEDDRAIALVLDTLLTSEGYSVITAPNPLAALGLLGPIAFDLILTDSFGPTFGLSTRTLRPILARAAGTPVVLVTAHRWPEEQVEAEGFAGVIAKPFDVEDVAARVERLRLPPLAVRC